MYSRIEIGECINNRVNWYNFCWNWMQFSHYVIQSDSFVYQSANFDPRIKILLFLDLCLVWAVENCTKLSIKVSWKPRNWKNKMMHQIDWNLIIPNFKYGVLTTFLSRTFQILILRQTYCYLLILQKLGCWKMNRNIFQDILEAVKWTKQKWGFF